MRCHTLPSSLSPRPPQPRLPGAHAHPYPKPGYTAPTTACLDLVPAHPPATAPPQPGPWRGGSGGAPAMCRPLPSGCMGRSLRRHPPGCPPAGISGSCQPTNPPPCPSLCASAPRQPITRQAYSHQPCVGAGHPRHVGRPQGSRSPPPQLRRPIPDHLTRPLPAPPLRLAPAEIGDALRTAKRGAAPGLSGSTMDHYKVLLEDEEAFAHLTAMVNTLANAEVPAPVLEALARARLTALTKPGGGIRGIATGEAFRRLTSRVLARHFATQFDLATRPFQFALQTRAGTDAVATILRYCTDANPAATVVCLDGRSAYDTVSRAAILAKVHECTPALLPYVKVFYGAQSSYSWFDDQGTVHEIVQGEGIEQGDSLAPALFAFAQHEALVHASRTLPAGDRLYAYLDDICVLTTRDHGRHAYDVVSRAIEGHAGIASNAGKTRVYHQDPGPPPPGIDQLGPDVWVGNQPPAQRGFVALGVPIGHPEFIACHLQARLAAKAELLEELPRLPDLQAAWLLLLFCAAPRAQHILRTVPPSQCLEYSTGHDAAI